MISHLCRRHLFHYAPLIGVKLTLMNDIKKRFHFNLSIYMYTANEVLLNKPDMTERNNYTLYHMTDVEHLSVLM
jgi:hypothetical protein